MNTEEKQQTISQLHDLINRLGEHIAKQENFDSLDAKDMAFGYDSGAANLKINEAVKEMDENKAALHDALIGLISRLEFDASFLEGRDLEVASKIVAGSTPTDTKLDIAETFSDLVETTDKQAIKKETTLDYLDQVIELSSFSVLKEKDKEFILDTSDEIATLMSTLENFDAEGDDV